jgi:hypothetical protein
VSRDHGYCLRVYDLDSHTAVVHELDSRNQLLCRSIPYNKVLIANSADRTLMFLHFSVFLGADVSHNSLTLNLTLPTLLPKRISIK